MRLFGPARVDEHWYSILPFMIEYKDPFALFAPPYNFIFVISRDEYQAINLYMKARNISSTQFESSMAPDAHSGPETGGKEVPFLPFKLRKYSYRLRTTTLHPLATDVVRDRLYDCFNNPKLAPTNLIVTAQKIPAHEALTNTVLKVKSRSRNWGPGARVQDARTQSLSQKNAEAIFVCNIFVNSDDPEAVLFIKDAIPQEMAQLAIKASSEREIRAKLDMKVSSYPSVNKVGAMMNFIGATTYRDTVLGKTELANIVQLPLNRKMYPIPKGQTELVSQSFVMSEDDKDDFVAPDSD